MKEAREVYSHLKITLLTKINLMLMVTMLFLNAAQCLLLVGHISKRTKRVTEISADENIKAHDDRVNGVKIIQEQLS